MSVIGPTLTVKARKAHNCFLCPCVIAPGSLYLRWAWEDAGSVSTLRAHPDCHSYAHDNIENYTNGDGVEDDAVAADLRETLSVYRQVDGWPDLAGHDTEKAAEIVATWPGLAGLVERIVREIWAEATEDERSPIVGTA